MTIRHAALIEEGKDAELDPAVVLVVYECNWPTVTSVTFC